MVALLATALSLLLRLAFNPLFNDSGPFLFFAPAVIVSDWYGGRGPGILATVLGAFAADYFLLVPAGEFSNSRSDVANVVVFLLVGIQISWLSGALLSAKSRAEEDVRKRTAELQFQKTLLEAQSNASLDGILVASDEGLVVFHNRQLPELWRVEEQSFAGSLDEAVRAMRGRLLESRDPLRSSDGPGIPGDAELPASLVLQDGRTLECYAAPVRSAEGRSYGRVWYFRDVTERKQLAKQILEAGERERQRIGLDLHDDLCQHLTGITFLGRVLQQRLSSRVPDEALAAGKIVDLVEQAVRRARDLARGLQPLQLQTGGLAVALKELASTIEEMFHVRCHFRCDEPFRVEDPATPIQLYRIAQEAITNAIRHGGARNVYVDLVELDGRLILTIEDDGSGIREGAMSPGLGLRTMRHRAAMVGATLSIEPADGTGTIVTCKLGTAPAGAVRTEERENV